ncbi:dihydroorotase [Oleiphilus messinensis]|uniref:Dihydroorotase n=1 Tax=Oleiphilus messinensis TaxID=141451 RepID=A0A1Y0IAI6_9GAMM|nr:dihydroorotase [Oleiphilus messinensis]ARU57518.1 dihydroorotase [Oleiphilus messinensis]
MVDSNTRLTLTRPDDWHLHFRDDDALETTVKATARVFQRAIVMPNLVPPVTNVTAALSYRERILSNSTEYPGFNPLMTLYLTDNTTPHDIIQAAETEHVVACKLYPAGATTNSDSGVTDISKMYPVFEQMAKSGILLLVHGEVTSPETDIFDREKRFLQNTLNKIVSDFPSLRVVLEHITTSEAVDFVNATGENVAATITPHHLMYNRNHMLAGGIRPHFYCLPILKRSSHQDALRKAASSGSPKFFLGTDSAPHTIGKKEAACGCAGCFSAFAAIEFYAEVFEELGALDKLEAFASHFGPDFYGLPRNTDTITLVREPWQAPGEIPMGDSVVVPVKAGEFIQWKVI